MGKFQNPPSGRSGKRFKKTTQKLKKSHTSHFQLSTNTLRDIEGYYTTEEALSNVVRKGLALLLREEGKGKRAEELENSWMIQVRR